MSSLLTERSPEPELDHDVDVCTLNGVTVADFEEAALIPKWPCEVCGQSVWVGVIKSTCGDTEKGVWVHVRVPGEEQFVAHTCGQPPRPMFTEDCKICFPVEDEPADEIEGFAPSLVIYDEVTDFTWLAECPKLGT